MQDKVVLITGASSGIGRALVVECAKRGAKIALAARRVDRLDELVNEFGSDRMLAVATDVTKEEQCREFIEKSYKHFGKIDVLINNAGISMRALFDESELDVLKSLMDVNFWGTVYCSKYAMPHLLESRGSLVGIISIAGHIGLPARSGYSASKFAVRGFLDTVRIENLNRGLHVLVAAPGFTASEVREKSLQADGQSQGKSPRNEQKMMSAERCAQIIVTGITKRKRSIVMTFVEGKVSVFLGKFFPKLLDRLTYNHMAKEPNSPLK